METGDRNSSMLVTGDRNFSTASVSTCSSTKPLLKSNGNEMLQGLLNLTIDKCKVLKERHYHSLYSREIYGEDWPWCPGL